MSKNKNKNKVSEMPLFYSGLLYFFIAIVGVGGIIAVMAIL
jgi:hypothetical protein